MNCFDYLAFAAVIAMPVLLCALCYIKGRLHGLAEGKRIFCDSDEEEDGRGDE